MTEIGNGINAGIAQNRYDAAMNPAAINANTTAQTQKILDIMSQKQNEALNNMTLDELQAQLEALNADDDDIDED